MTDDRCELLCLDLSKAEALRAARTSEPDARALAAGFRALGDPTRLILARALRDGGELSFLRSRLDRRKTGRKPRVPPRAYLRAAGLADFAATERWRSTR